MVNLDTGMVFCFWEGTTGSNGFHLHDKVKDLLLVFNAVLR